MRGGGKGRSQGKERAYREANEMGKGGMKWIWKGVDIALPDL